MKLEQQQENYCLITQKKKQVQEQKDNFYHISSFYLNSPLLPKKKKSNNHIGIEMTDTQASASSVSSGTTTSLKSTNRRKSKRNSSGTSNVFRNLITCRGLDTNDSVLVMSNCSHKSSADTNKEQSNGTKDCKFCGLAIRKGETLVMYAEVFGGCCDQQLQQIQNKRYFLIVKMPFICIISANQQNYHRIFIIYLNPKL